MNPDFVARPMTIDDLPLVLAWRNDASVRKYMLSQHEISPEEHRRWFGICMDDERRHLLIVEDAGQPLGFVQLTKTATPQVADWGFYAAPKAARGTGKKLGRASLDFAFAQLNLHKVCGQALSFNDGSIALHRSLGFRQEGVLRDQCLLNDRFYDLVCFGLLKNEWTETREALQGDRI